MQVNNLPPVKITQFDQFNSVLNSLSQLRDQTQINTIERIAVTFAKNHFSLSFKTRPSLLQRICSFFYKPKQLRLGFVVEKTVNFLEAHKDYLLNDDCLKMVEQFQMRLFSIRNIHTKASASLTKLDQLINQVKIERQNILEKQQLQQLNTDTAKILEQETDKQKEIENNSANAKNTVAKAKGMIKQTLDSQDRGRNAFFQFAYNDDSDLRFGELFTSVNKTNDCTFETTDGSQKVPSIFFSKFLVNAQGLTIKIPYKTHTLQDLLRIFEGKKYRDKSIPEYKVHLENFLHLCSLAFFLKHDQLATIFSQVIRDLFNKYPYFAIQAIELSFSQDNKDFLRDGAVANFLIELHSKIEFANLYSTSERIENLIKSLQDRLTLLKSVKAKTSMLENIPKVIDELRRINVF